MTTRQPAVTSIRITPRSTSWTLVSFATLIGISLVIWWTPLASTLTLALSDEQYTHILLILPISATLLVIERKCGRKPDLEKSEQFAASSHLAIGAAFLATTILLNFVVNRKMHRPSDLQLAASMLSLTAWWIASYALCFGMSAFRLALFPLLFLLWLIPLPDFLLDSVIRLLQQGSAASAHFLFATAGVQVAQRGMLIHIPGLTLAVAPECSSIRSSLMLVVTTMVLAHLLLRSPWRKLLAVAVAIPLSILKNGLRIFTLGMLATRVNPGFLTGRLHRQGGGIFFLIALAAIFLLIWILSRTDKERPGLKARTLV